MRVYITYCSAQKNDALRNTGLNVTPDVLYASERIQSFIQECKQKGVKWAIFSDLYGIWFQEEKHEWYDKSPDDVTASEFRELLENFNRRLAEYDEICFYMPKKEDSRPLYKRLLDKSRLRRQIRIITKVSEIK